MGNLQEEVSGNTKSLHPPRQSAADPRNRTGMDISDRPQQGRPQPFVRSQCLKPLDLLRQERISPILCIPY
jgi:hypothetical protein